MSSIATQFPVLGSLNAWRKEAFNKAHGFEKSESEKPATSVCYWLQHKAICAVAIPANIVGMTLGTVAAATSACMLGALKVGVYALTLGNIRPEFSTEVVSLGERSFFAGFNAVWAIGEIVYDVVGLCVEVPKTLYKVLL